MALPSRVILPAEAVVSHAAQLVHGDLPHLVGNDLVGRKHFVLFHAITIGEGSLIACPLIIRGHHKLA